MLLLVSESAETTGKLQIQNDKMEWNVYLRKQTLSGHFEHSENIQI